MINYDKLIEAEASHALPVKEEHSAKPTSPLPVHLVASRFDRWVQGAQILAAGIALVGLPCLIFQISQQREQMELDNRPQLYVNIKPEVFEVPGVNADGSRYWNLFIGAKLEYRNSGKTPASNVKTEISLYNDADRSDQGKHWEDWYMQAAKFVPRVSAVFPGQADQDVHIRVDASELATEYLVSLRITYSGQTPRRHYWYAADMKCMMSRCPIVKPIEAGAVIPPEGRVTYPTWENPARISYDGSTAKPVPAASSNPYQ